MFGQACSDPSLVAAENLAVAKHGVLACRTWLLSRLMPSAAHKPQAGMRRRRVAFPGAARPTPSSLQAAASTMALPHSVPTCTEH